MNNKHILMPIVAIGFVATLVLTVSSLQNRQDIRQRASGINPSVSMPVNGNSDSHQLPLPPEDKAYKAPNDTLPPTVNLINLTNGQSVKGGTTITLSTNATDNTGVEKVEFLVNGGIICTATTSPYTCSWNIPSVSNTSYIVVTRAYDQTGNISSKSVVVNAN